MESGVGGGPPASASDFSSRPAAGTAFVRGTPREAVAETVLPSGVRVLTEYVPGVRSASVGVWVKRGAAHEAAGDLGSSHLLEHLVFKGTARRTAREIALSLEGLGGSLDAYTSREHTSYQARVLDSHLPEALDVLADLVLDPALREEDLALEREVVLEEISTVEDTPEDLVFELHAARLWEGHPYGHSILGTRESVAGSTSGRLREIHRASYVAGNLVLAAAGNVRHEEVVDRALELFDRAAPGPPPPEVAPARGAAAGEVRVVRDRVQAHLVFGTATVPHADPRRYALVLLAAAFGGGMSSRLFQRIREELALCYTVYTVQAFHRSGGFSGVYVGTRPGWEERATEAVLEEHRRLAREGLPPEELEHTRQQVKGQVMLSLESTAARLYRLASLALYDEPYQGLDELLKKIDAVSKEEVDAAAQAFFAPERQLVLLLGPDH